MNCKEKYKDVGDFGVDNIILTIFTKEPEEKNYYYINFREEILESFLMELLFKALNFKYNIKSLEEIEIFHMKKMEEYFNSLGFTIIVNKNFDKVGELAFDVGFDYIN